MGRGNGTPAPTAAQTLAAKPLKDDGDIVRTGLIRRNTKARLLRDSVVIKDDLSVESLRRFKDDATEVREGYECGIGLGSFNDIKVDDVIETFERVERPATL